MAAFVEVAAADLFSKGLAELRDGKRLHALSFFEKSYKVEKNTECGSYLGYLIAQERGRIIEGLSLCNAALEADGENPMFYLNLGRVLYKAERKVEAIQTVRRALYCGPCLDAEAWLEVAGKRRKPLFPFLPRRHFLNKYGGIIMSRLSRLKKTS